MHAIEDKFCKRRLTDKNEKTSEISVPSNITDRTSEKSPTMKQLKIEQTFFAMHSEAYEKVTNIPKCQIQRGA